MSITFRNRGLFLSPESAFIVQSSITHIANPVVVSMPSSAIRIYFNSRNQLGASEIWSIDLISNDLVIDQSTLRKQFSIDSHSPDYCKRGISLGNFFYHQGVPHISFMGWRDHVTSMWEGAVGFLKLDSNFDVFEVSETPIFSPDRAQSLSLSYPHVVSSSSEFQIWVGCTVTWDGGNGEMVHPLRKYALSHDLSNHELILEVPHNLGLSQAFSRPNFIRYRSKEYIAYSVRGSKSKYRIEFCEILRNNSLVQPYKFESTGIGWESDMVEYPYLAEINNHLIMFYNGNGFGQSGLGRVEVEIR